MTELLTAEFTSNLPLHDAELVLNMAPANGVHSLNGFHPPPSSILATRVVNGDDSSDFNQDSFNQLLEESLGTDENGQPNLGSDVSINHKLICIIIKAGVHPFLRDLRDNPFQSNGAPSHTDAQISCCLDVIRTSIGRSPQIVFTKSVPEDQASSGTQIPLYSWLIPKLLPLLITGVSEAVRDAALKSIDAVLAADEDILRGSQGNAVFDFILGCVTGMALAPSSSAS